MFVFAAVTLEQVQWLGLLWLLRVATAAILFFGGGVMCVAVLKATLGNDQKALRHNLLVSVMISFLVTLAVVVLGGTIPCITGTIVSFSLGIFVGARFLPPISIWTISPATQISHAASPFVLGPIVVIAAGGLTLFGVSGKEVLVLVIGHIVAAAFTTIFAGLFPLKQDHKGE